MPKQTLVGTLDEQCAFLYEMAREKMAEGNYTGAVHALQEILKYQPNFRDTTTLLAEAKTRKSQQSRLVLAGFLGAILFVGVGTTLHVSNDLLFLALALLGAVVGYASGLILFSQKVVQKETPP